MTPLPWRKTLDSAFESLEPSPAWTRNLVLGSFPSLGRGNWPANWREMGIIKGDTSVDRGITVGGHPRGPRHSQDWMGEMTW